MLSVPYRVCRCREEGKYQGVISLPQSPNQKNLAIMDYQVTMVIDELRNIIAYFTVFLVKMT